MNVPKGKRVLNTHVSEDEHAHLKRRAKAAGVTMTTWLRSLIWADMDADAKPKPRRGSR